MMEKVQVKFLVDFSEREDAPKQGDVIEVDQNQANVWSDNNIVEIVVEKKKGGK